MARRHNGSRTNKCSFPATNTEGHGIQQPRVSIGLPVYNGEKYLKQAIGSVLSQTFRDFELIISDNCSTDATQDICLEFVGKDPRITYHRNERNLGAAANFNKALALARGDLFSWVNDDDLWGTTYLEKCVAMLERRPDLVLAYAHAAKIDADGAFVAPLICRLGLDDPSPKERLRRYHNHSRDIDRRNGWGGDDVEGLWVPFYGLVRTHVLRKTGLVGAYISADTVLIEELLIHGAFGEVEDRLFFKRDHPGRSMRACVSYDKRIDWFTGRRGGRLLFPRWRLFRERLGAALRPVVPTLPKLACLFEMLAYYIRRPCEGRGLIKEILANGPRLISGPGGAAGALERW